MSATTVTKPKPVTVPAWRLTGKQPVKPYRNKTARAAWWVWVQAQLASGPVAVNTLYQQASKAPPSLQPNGKFGKAGQVEPPNGWFRFFAGAGLVQATNIKLSPAQAKAQASK